MHNLLSDPLIRVRLVARLRPQPCSPSQHQAGYVPRPIPPAGSTSCAAGCLWKLSSELGYDTRVVVRSGGACSARPFTFLRSARPVGLISGRARILVGERVLGETPQTIRLALPKTGDTGPIDLTIQSTVVQPAVHRPVVRPARSRRPRVSRGGRTAPRAARALTGGQWPHLPGHGYHGVSAQRRHEARPGDRGAGEPAHVASDEMICVCKGNPL